jgi:hypothetical protein
LKLAAVQFEAAAGALVDTARVQQLHFSARLGLPAAAAAVAKEQQVVTG